MGEATNIQWCDATFNPWRGCSRVSTGCKNCYAASEAIRFPQNRGIWGPNGTRVLAAPSMWKKPLAWNRQSEITHERYEDYCIAGGGVGTWGGPVPSRPRVFCASLADVFEDWQGPIHDHHGNRAFMVFDRPQKPERDSWLTMADVRKSLFDLIDATPNLDWLLLTKRPESIRRFWKPRDLETRVQDFGMDRSMFRENVWLGTSVAEQQDAEKNIPELLNCRDLSPVLFVSAEPLVGPVDLIQPMQDADGFLDWVIVGGESGHGARPCDLAWIRSIVKQCKKAGTSVFVKQLGSKPDWNISDSKGGDYSEFPKDLQVREFPK